MTQIVSEQLKNLEQIQEIDLKIDSLKKNQNSLPTELKKIDDSSLKLHISLTEKKNRISDIEKNQKQSKAAVELNQDRLTRANAKLETVQNSQEYQAATKEIEQLKKLGVTLEEQAQKLNADAESAQKELQTLEEQVQKLKTDRETHAKTLSGQDDELNQQISLLQAEREKYSPSIELRIMAQYDRVRGARAGLGIVPAVAGRCKGCNMIVPPQLYNEIQRGSAIHSCPSCHRMLFVPIASKV